MKLVFLLLFFLSGVPQLYLAQLPVIPTPDYFELTKKPKFSFQHFYTEQNKVYFEEFSVMSQWLQQVFGRKPAIYIFE